MSVHWYYSHDGVTHGPFSDEEIQDHAARKMLLETDLIWPEGKGRKDAAPAAVVVDSAQLSAAPSLISDWLADVAALETTGPAPGLVPTDEIPEWLEDLRLWLGLELYTPAKPTTNEDAQSPTGGTPDWLEGWLTPNEPIVAQQLPSPAKPVSPAIPVAIPVSPPPADKPAPTIPAASPVTPTGKSVVPIPLATPVPPPPADKPARAVPAAIPVPVPPPDKAVPIAQPAPPPTALPPTDKATKAAKQRTAHPLVEKVLHASGFDMETWQILDPVKFQKWKQQQAQSTPVSNASLFEVFRKARRAVEAWVDDEANRPCIMQTDIEEIKRLPAIVAILHGYANYGQPMQVKLVRHLEFMVENRKKYYRAVEIRRTS